MIIIKMILYILAFIVVLIGTYYCCRFIASMQSGVHKSKHMKIEDKLILTKDNTIEIIRVGEKCLLLGITNNNISILRELNEDDLVQEKSECEEIITFDSIVKNIINYLIDAIKTIYSRIRQSNYRPKFIDILKEKENITSHPLEEKIHEK